jgi:hypothetical protein
MSVLGTSRISTLGIPAQRNPLDVHPAYQHDRVSDPATGASASYAAVASSPEGAGAVSPSTVQSPSPAASTAAASGSTSGAALASLQFIAVPASTVADPVPASTTTSDSVLAANAFWNDVVARIRAGESPKAIQEANAKAAGTSVFPGQGPEQVLPGDAYLTEVIGGMQGRENAPIDVSLGTDWHAVLATSLAMQAAGTYRGVNTGLLASQDANAARELQSIIDAARANIASGLGGIATSTQAAPVAASTSAGQAVLAVPAAVARTAPALPAAPVAAPTRPAAPPAAPATTPTRPHTAAPAHAAATHRAGPSHRTKPIRHAAAHPVRKSSHAPTAGRTAPTPKVASDLPIQPPAASDRVLNGGITRPASRGVTRFD